MITTRTVPPTTYKQLKDLFHEQIQMSFHSRQHLHQRAQVDQARVIQLLNPLIFAMRDVFTNHVIERPFPTCPDQTYLANLKFGVSHDEKHLIHHFWLCADGFTLIDIAIDGANVGLYIGRGHKGDPEPCAVPLHELTSDHVHRWASKIATWLTPQLATPD